MAIRPIKMMGAYTLTNESSATSATLYSLDKIPTGVMSVNDIVFTQQDGALYFHNGVDEGYDITENLPYYVKPNDETGYKRWKLFDIYGNSIVSNVITSIDETGLTLSALTSSGSVAGSIAIGDDGNVTVTDSMSVSGILNLTTLTIESSAQVDNLNAQFIQGQGISNFILEDGSIPFTGTIVGVAPTASNHLATKAYTDEITDGTKSFFLENGTALFTIPVSGVTPTLPIHLTTKEYVDDNISDELAWTIVTNVTELEQALADTEKRIYTKNGTYNLTQDITPYDGLVILGESKENVIIYYSSGTATIINHSSVSSYYTNKTTSLISQGDSVINIQPLGADIPAGSITSFDGYTYILELSASSTDTTLTITEPIYQDTEDFAAVSGTDIRIHRTENLINDLTLDNLTISSSGGGMVIDIGGGKNINISNINQLTEDGVGTSITLDYTYNSSLENCNVYSDVTCNNNTNFKINNIKQHPSNTDTAILSATHNTNTRISNIIGDTFDIRYHQLLSMTNCHIPVIYDFNFTGIKRAYITNCSSYSSGSPFSFDSTSKWFTLTGCQAPSSSTPIDTTGIDPQYYSIHGNHWQTDDFSPTITTPISGEILSWDGNQWVNGNDVNYLQFYSHDVGSHPSTASGNLHYHRHNSEEQWLTVFNDKIDIDLGGQCVIPVRNESGALIEKGMVCAATSGAGGVAFIELAIANSTGNANKTIGFAAHDIANGAYGWILGQGHLYNFDLSVTKYPDIYDGCCLYLSATTSGYVTSQAPVPPNYNVRVGLATNVSASAGKICARIGITPQFSDIMGLPASAFGDGELAIWDASTQKWGSSSILDGNYTFTGTISAVNDVKFDGDIIGSLNVSADTAFATPVSGATPTLDNHFVTKAYSDANAIVTWSRTIASSSWTELWVNGTASNRLSVAQGFAKHFEIFISTTDTATGNTNAYKINGLIKNDTGTTSLVNSNVTIIGEEDVDVNVRVVADDTNDTLNIEGLILDSTSTDFVANMTYGYDISITP